MVINCNPKDEVLKTLPQRQELPKLSGKFVGTNKKESHVRNQLLQTQLRLAHLKEGEQEIRQICAEYVDVFKLPGDKLTATSAIEELEGEQQSFLRISQEQMIILKSAITSFSITMQKVNKNKKILNENLQRLSQLVVDEINKMHSQLDPVLIINENIRQTQRGMNECQHTFEILVDAFLHAQDGIIQPQLITIAKVKDMMKELSLPDRLDLPPFPS